MGVEVDYYEELEVALRDAWDDSAVMSEPAENGVIGKFTPPPRIVGQKPGVVHVVESNPWWWEDWMAR